MNCIESKIYCPFCGEFLTVLVDSTEGQYVNVEDCQVCCSPMVITSDVVDGELVSIDVQREND